MRRALNLSTRDRSIRSERLVGRAGVSIFRCIAADCLCTSKLQVAASLRGNYAPKCPPKSSSSLPVKDCLTSVKILDNRQDNLGRLSSFRDSRPEEAVHW